MLDPELGLDRCLVDHAEVHFVGVAVGIKGQPRRLRRHAEGNPGLTAAVPYQVRCLQPGGFGKCLSAFEAVVGAKPDHIHVGVLLSKLLNARRFGPAGASSGGPEPHQGRCATGERVELDRGAVIDVVDGDSRKGRDGSRRCTITSSVVSGIPAFSRSIAAFGGAVA